MPVFRVMYRHPDRPDRPEYWTTYREFNNGKDAGELCRAQKACRYNGSLVWRVKQITDDDLWREREQRRFADEYEPTPWHEEPFYQAKHNDHFCHLSLTQPGKVSYTETPEKGAADRQTIIAPGRYLRKHFGDTLSAAEIEEWACKVSVAADACCLHITQDADEIEEVYVNGPRSCMSYDADEYSTGLIHPSRVYAGPDLAVAYTGTREKASGRAVVWPEKKVYNEIYGDCSRMRLLLKAVGYAPGELNGARVRKITTRHGDIVMPYVDGVCSAEDYGDFIRLGSGHLSCSETTGLACGGATCDRCGDRYDNDNEGYYLEDIEENWCDDCGSNFATYCEVTERYYGGDVETVEVHSSNLYPFQWHQRPSPYNPPLALRYETATAVLEAIEAHPDYTYVEDRDEWWDRRVYDVMTAIEAIAQVTVQPELPLEDAA